jgi:hypothetical protein
MYADLIAEGRLRDVPVVRILDGVSNLVYGTMFTNHFTGRHKPLEAQAKDLVDILFFGLLSDRERASHHAADTRDRLAANGANGDLIASQPSS